MKRSILVLGLGLWGAVASAGGPAGSPTLKKLLFLGEDGVVAIPFEAPAPQAAPKIAPVVPDEPQAAVSGLGLQEKDLEIVYQMSAAISRYYADPLKSKQLFYGALRGMAQSLDSHSTFMDPDEFKEYMDHFNGATIDVGIGLGEKKEGEAQPVAYVVPGSAAHKAGVRAGDKIVQLNGVSADAMTAEEAAKALKGKEGSSLTLTLADGSAAARSVTLTRAPMDPPEVYGELLAPRKIGYVYVAQLRGNTVEKTKKIIVDLSARGAASFIIDLRSNRGGDFETAGDLAALFLPEGTVIAKFRDRQGAEAELTSQSEWVPAFPIKILIDEYTEGGAELFVAALKENKRATVIGGKSHGTGVVQKLIVFKDRSALKVSFAKWFTPSGKSIQRDDAGNGGVIPDVAVPVSQDVERKAVADLLRKLYQTPASGKPVSDPILERALAK